MTKDKCQICKFSIDEIDKEMGYFIDNNKIYCEKCYANKRFVEIVDKTKWHESVQNLINTNPRIEIVMKKIPNDWESLINDQVKVKKIRDEWKKKKWNV